MAQHNRKIVEKFLRFSNDENMSLDYLCFLEEGL